jgi:arginine decarboxylase
MPLNQSRCPILESLLTRADSEHTPFYTPGHRQGRGSSTAIINALGSAALRADLSEIPGLDNLFAPEDSILQAQELAADAFGAERTWFLVNGSTVGVMAAILATCDPGDQIILPRNVHQSAIAGLILAGAMPIWVQPAFDPQTGLVYSLTPESVHQALAHSPQAKAVFLVYPTYEGVCADIREIAQVAHQHQIPLLVDEAHGGHFGFHLDLPISALAAGADLSVQSTHKVLSALTQAAMLHLQGDRLCPQRLHQGLRLLQSSSPSYLLLASLDAARQQMALHGEALLTETLTLAHQARSDLQGLPPLWVLGPTSQPGFADLDLTRLTVRVSPLGLTGFEADQILEQEWGIIAEMPSLDYLTFIISLGNTAADIQRLMTGLKTLTKNHQTQIPPALILPPPLPYSGQTQISVPELSPRAAYFAPTETVAIARAVDRISAEMVCPYPPGIPVLCPGERITAPALATLNQIFSQGGLLTGWSDPSWQTLKVIKG